MGRPDHDLSLLMEFRSPTTFTAVSQRLGVAHTTVARKLRDLEAYFGTRLTERVGETLRLTDAGEQAAGAAERMDGELAALERRISSHDERLGGSIRLTTVDILALRYLPTLSAFARRHPGIELEIETDPQVRSLSRREAEVALRLTNSPDDQLSGIVLERLDFHAYRRQSPPPAPTDLSQLHWLDYRGHECSARAADWMRVHAGNARAQIYVSTPLVMLEAVENGAGAGMLPSAIADANPTLQRLSDIPSFSIDVWLLAPLELRRTARVRALFETLKAGPLTRQMVGNGGNPT